MNELGNPKPFKLVGSGTLTVPIQCTAISNSFSLKNDIRGNSSLLTELPYFHLSPLDQIILPNFLQNVSLLPILQIYQHREKMRKMTLMGFEKVN